MKTNVGGIDRIVRLLAGVALIAAGALGMVAEPWNMIAMGAGAVFAVTSVFSFCPLYTLFGINSCPMK